MTNSVTEAQVRAALADLVDPEIGRTLAELRMLTGIRIGPAGGIDVQVELPTPAYPDRARITEAIRQAVALRIPGAAVPAVEYTWRVKGKDSGGAIGLRVKNVIAVGSGKGGVGKSTVAASIALGLHRAGAKVGLMDADVYGPSVPHMFGVNERPMVVQDYGPDGQVFERMAPIEADGLKLMSIGFLLPAEDPMPVRGPILHRTIEQFLRQTAWGDLDYLIVDMPPGTGDVALSLSQLLGLAGGVIVCTPQQLALLDAVKALNMFRKVKIPVLGIVENMSGDLFGRGGAKRKAEEMGVPFLGEVPLDVQVRINEDAGRLRDNFAETCASRQPLQHVAEQVAIQVARTLLETPSMPTLEIL